ncbi:DUF2269 family protein [Cohnella fermenti]|uniref:DUF2269 family protein n=1 Tax=Cohnella fermenti TaxID=2565925 RepID=A0A4S4C7I4_9BACL|nr:DUF2269 family protein [Cohnella fermenti]THF83254.1 DUF2269 family protein [Cohnella fermenti]
MQWLVALHVVSAFLGIGPTYFGHFLFRRNQQPDQLRQAMGYFQALNYFPKIGGTIAVLSGIALVVWTGWEFTDIWIAASIVLYVLIQVVAIGLLGPQVERLAKALDGGDGPAIASLVKEANHLFNVVSVLGIVLILLMVVKPM